jgi:hypothetical protein
MSPGGAAPRTAPVSWVYLARHRHDGYTIRWQRGDPVASALTGNRLDDHGITEVLDTIPVLPAGWTDLVEIRRLGERWLRSR